MRLIQLGQNRFPCLLRCSIFRYRISDIYNFRLEFVMLTAAGATVEQPCYTGSIPKLQAKYSWIIFGITKRNLLIARSLEMCLNCDNELVKSGEMKRKFKIPRK